MSKENKGLRLTLEMVSGKIVEEVSGYYNDNNPSSRDVRTESEFGKDIQSLIKSYARQCCNQTLHNVGIGMSESYYYPEEIRE